MQCIFEKRVRNGVVLHGLLFSIETRNEGMSS